MFLCGQDEVISVSEKVVMRVSDLATWIVDDVKWERGAPAVWERQCLTPPATPPLERTGTEDGQSGDGGEAARGPLDMRDVLKEKQSIGKTVASRCVSRLLFLTDARVAELGSSFHAPAAS